MMRVTIGVLMMAMAACGGDPEPDQPAPDAAMVACPTQEQNGGASEGAACGTEGAECFTAAGMAWTSTGTRERERLREGVAGGGEVAVAVMVAVPA